MLLPRWRASRLLAAFGAGGLFGDALACSGIVLPFTEWAVVLAAYLRSLAVLRPPGDHRLPGRRRRAHRRRAHARRQPVADLPARRAPMPAGGPVAGWALAFARGIGGSAPRRCSPATFAARPRPSRSRTTSSSSPAPTSRSRRHPSRRAQRGPSCCPTSCSPHGAARARHRPHPSRIRVSSSASPPSARRSRSSDRWAPARSRPARRGQLARRETGRIACDGHVCSTPVTASTCVLRTAPSAWCSRSTRCSGTCPCEPSSRSVAGGASTTCSSGSALRILPMSGRPRSPAGVLCVALAPAIARESAVAPRSAARRSLRSTPRRRARRAPRSAQLAPDPAPPATDHFGDATALADRIGAILDGSPAPARDVEEVIARPDRLRGDIDRGTCCREGSHCPAAAATSGPRAATCPVRRVCRSHVGVAVDPWEASIAPAAPRVGPLRVNTIPGTIVGPSPEGGRIRLRIGGAHLGVLARGGRAAGARRRPTGLCDVPASRHSARAPTVDAHARGFDQVRSPIGTAAPVTWISGRPAATSTSSRLGRPRSRPWWIVTRAVGRRARARADSRRTRLPRRLSPGPPMMRPTVNGSRRGRRAALRAETSCTSSGRARHALAQRVEPVVETGEARLRSLQRGRAAVRRERDPRRQRRIELAGRQPRTSSARSTSSAGVASTEAARSSASRRSGRGRRHPRGPAPCPPAIRASRARGRRGRASATPVATVVCPENGTSASGLKQRMRTWRAGRDGRGSPSPSSRLGGDRRHGVASSPAASRNSPAGFPPSGLVGARWP